MNLKLVAAGIATALLLGACSDEKTSSPSQATVTASVAVTPSGLGRTAPAHVDLSTLEAKPLTGDAPNKLPNWKPGGDAKKYSVETLNFLVAATTKSGIALPPIKYAFYEGDPELILSCSDNPHMHVEARKTLPVTYCGDIDAILIIPSNWPDINPWGEGGLSHPPHSFIESLSFAHDPTQIYEPEQYCVKGKIYGGLVATQPNLGTSVVNRMFPPMPDGVERHPAEKWMLNAYALAAAGVKESC